MNFDIQYIIMSFIIALLFQCSTDYVDYADNESTTSFESRDINSERYNFILYASTVLARIKSFVLLKER